MSSFTATKKIIPARYSGKCFVCGNDFNKGEQIQGCKKPGLKRYKWAHKACARGEQPAKSDSKPETKVEKIESQPVESQPVESKPNKEAAAQALLNLLAGSGQDIEARDLAKTALAAVLELQEKVAELDKRQPRKQEIKLRRPDVDTKKLEGHFHPIFKKLVELLNARKPVFIPGPTGCGKTHIARQAAEALDLPFYFVSCTAGMSEGQLTGRLLPIEAGGKFGYVSAGFVEAYEKGGVFLLDEIDAADPNVLLVINAALANGHCSLPNRIENPVAKRHEDFCCIAAANTWGTGADRRYVGRTQLDAATLDRFTCGQIAMDYDEAFERGMVGNLDVYETLLGYRKKINEARLERTVSTRFMLDADDMVCNHGWNQKRVDEAFFAGWSPDELKKVKS